MCLNYYTQTEPAGKKNDLGYRETTTSVIPLGRTLTKLNYEASWDLANFRFRNITVGGEDIIHLNYKKNVYFKTFMVVRLLFHLILCV